MSDTLNPLHSGCDIEGETLRGLVLDGISLRGSKFIDCIFEQCSFNSVDLTDAVLQARFVGCKMQGINFFTAKRTLLDIGFSNCLIRYCSFAELKMTDADLSGCTLEHVDFADAQLPGAIFKDSQFTDCTFKNTNLAKADFRGARGYLIDPTLNRLLKARFELPEAVSLLAPFNIRLD